MTASSTAIRLAGVGYRHASRRHDALAGIDLEVDAGEIVLLTGDSGAGKSTLLHALAGLLNDEDDGVLRGRLEATGTVGMVLQDPDSQVISARVGDDVAFGAENLGVRRDEIWRRVERALDIVGLDLPLDHPTSQLSGGQKQRLALAGVLAMGADIIVLDEPTANLDPVGRAAIVAAVGQLRQRTNVTVIIAEHRPHHWLELHPTLYRLGETGLLRLDSLPEPPRVGTARAVTPGTEPLVVADDLLTQWGPPRTLQLPRGHSSVITGPNGSGKSTLAATLGGLVAPRSGRLNYHENLRRGLTGPAHRWKSSDLAQRIGFVFQDPEYQFAFQTVHEELAASGAATAEVDTLMERLRLTHLSDANPFTLSGGEKRRLSVATALITKPMLLLCDEPTFGQDDAGFLELLELFRDITDDGRTVVSITHDELFQQALGDHEVSIS